MPEETKEDVVEEETVKSTGGGPPDGVCLSCEG